MKGKNHMKTKMKKTMNISYTAFALFAFACLALSPTAGAVSPPPDGGYPGENTAEGDNALFGLTDGSNNTAMGFDALYSNTTGSDNTANGSLALFINTTGYYNTATGYGALYANTTGGNNTANGAFALQSNTTGTDNTANGHSALGTNTTGGANTANGSLALTHNTLRAWLLCAFSPDASGHPGAGWGLSRRQYGRGPKRPFESHHGHI